MAYSFVRTVIIDHTLCGGGNTANYPFSFFGTYAYLKTVANGGQAQNANGYDIGFFTSSDGTGKLDWETEVYTSGTGRWAGWVRVPTATHSADATIYLAYDSTTVTTDQSNKTGVWGSNAKEILHFGDGSSVSFANSATGAHVWNGNNTPTAGAGQMYGAMVSTTNQFALMNANDDDSTGVTAMSASIWFKPSSNPATANGIMQWADTTGSSTPAWLVQNNTGTLKYYADSNYRETSQTMSSGTWYNIVITLASGTTWKFYLNGSILSTYTGGTTQFGGSNSRFAVALGFAGEAPGTYDEFHAFVGETLSADRILGEYNNQKASSTLVTVGSEVAA